MHGGCSIVMLVSLEDSTVCQALGDLFGVPISSLEGLGGLVNSWNL